MVAIVIGGTGLVGSNLLRQLEERKEFTLVRALVRKAPPNSSNRKIVFVEIDFDNLNPKDFIGDVLFCALGTTIKKAKTKENQYKIDVLYNYNCARLAKENNVHTVAHVSAMGAEKESAIFYSRIKGDLEEKLVSLDFAKTIIVRPSLILGERREKRVGESIAKGMFLLFNWLFIGPLKKYKGVQAHKIAKCLIDQCFVDTKKKVVIIENENI